MGTSFYTQPALCSQNGRCQQLLVDAGDGTDGAAAYQVIDRVSTIYLSKWLMAGQNGRTRAGEQEDRFQTADVTPLVSAYRNINVTGDWDPRATDDGIEPNAFGKKAVPNGVLAGAWVASTTRFNMVGAFRGTPGSLYIGPTVGITAAEKTSIAVRFRCYQRNPVR